ncbi:MAG: CsgG/HfaB family protein [Spirochaetes bacterium]|nr:CsgG/HfaB family protein [Spirochaetota bacterium]
MKILNFIVLFLLLFSTGFVRADELDTKMEKIVQQFNKDTSALSVEIVKASLAVFPFDCDEKLAQKRVNLAVSELLTKHLIQSSDFKLVERTHLDKILKEQELGLTGAIDTPTAAKVGKLIGAKLVALGSISRVGDYYQISSRLVDVESSEIISVSIVEVSVEVFDQKASRYLVKVPEYQTLGIYLAFQLFPASVTELPSRTFFNSLIVTPDNNSVLFEGLGLGLRYWFLRKLMIDIAYFPVTAFVGDDAFSSDSGSSELFAVSGATNLDGSEHKKTLSGSSFKLSLNWYHSISKTFKMYAGIGANICQLNYGSEEEMNTISGTANGQNFMIHMQSLNELSPQVLGFCRLGLEWKLQTRLGWALFMNINTPKKFPCKVTVKKYNSNWMNVISEEEMLVREVIFPLVTLETTISFYF